MDSYNEKNKLKISNANSKYMSKILHNSFLIKIKYITKYIITIIFSLIILLLLFYFFNIFKYNNENNTSTYTYDNRDPEIKFDVNFEYHKYQRNIITDKIINNSNWQLGYEEPYFINGIIRKYKPKKCLEIGVAYGGSSILILNAIKDIKDSFLISLDLNTYLYTGEKLETGYNVKKYFPELTDKWKLYTGDQPHKFLDKLNLKFDFLYLDTSHITPGEIINIIEALPFLEDNAIVILHDIMFHFFSYHKSYFNYNSKIHFSPIYLITSLMGDKAILENKEIGLENIGAVRLFSNQDKYYNNYFLLLLSPWEYMPTDNQIDDLRVFIKKYYKQDIYLKIFNKAVKENKIYLNK